MSSAREKAVVLYIVNVDWFFLSHRLPVALMMQSAGFDVHVAGASTGKEELFKRYGLAFHAVLIPRQGMNPVQALEVLWRLRSLCRRVRPTLVHNITMKPILFGTFAARLAGASSIVNAVPGLGVAFTATGFRIALIRFGITAVLRLVARIRGTHFMVQNEENRDFLLSRVGIAPERIALIKGAGVEVDKVPERPEPQGTPRVVFAARLLRQKGILDFVAVARLLAQEGVSAEFVVAGPIDTGNPSSISEMEIRRWVDEGVVEWLGDCDDIIDLFARSHVVCLPTYYGEGVPKVLIEAAAAARAIVTTDIPGCRDIVRDRWNGLLVPPRNREALAEALRELLSNPDMRKHMGKRGRDLAKQEFDLSLVLEQTRTVYERLGVLDRAGHAH